MNTMHELVGFYAAHLRALNRAPKTIAASLNWLSRFLAFVGEAGIQAPQEVDIEALRAYQRHVANRINARGTVDSVKVQNQHLGAVCGFLGFLHIEGVLGTNPACHLELAKVPRRLPRTVLSVREVKRLLRVPDTSTRLGYRDRTILEVLYSTGIRRQELLRLAVEDVDFDSASLMVRQGKGGKDRVVPLGRIAAGCLQHYIRVVRPAGWPAGGEPTGAVFLSARGSPLSRNALAWGIERSTRQAGLSQRVTPHVFRHTCATHMVRNRAGIRHVQEMLGHGSLATTEQYVHLAISDLKEAHRRFHPRERDE